MSPRLLDFVLGKIIALGCILSGAALAGYTGLVLTNTNRPLWGDTAWITLLFFVSGISAEGAAMILFGWRQGHPGTVRWIEQMERYSSVLELIVLAVIAATIWSVVRVVWNGAWVRSCSLASACSASSPRWSCARGQARWARPPSPSPRSWC